MSMWPEDMKVGPIREWPGTMTAAESRRVSPFRSTLTSTLRTLDRELYELAETRAHRESAELLIALPAGAFRLDGRPRAGSRPEHPGVILSMDTRHGHLSYPCDTFTSWEDNLRAIALALEALRKVDRYGVTRRGEQYRGFLELESGGQRPMGVDGAIRALLTVLGYGEEVRTSDVELMQLVRRAKRYAHPDTSANPHMVEVWGTVVDAERVLREAGRL